MLTIKSPIKISANSSIIKSNNSFAERMEANYQVMVSSLSPEVMLHFIAGQSDVLIEGDSMTSLVSVNQKINRQQINVELVNNVLNRILAIDNSVLNYQDRTFIDTVLRRIGITDVNQFIRQIQVMKQNTNQVNELIQQYKQGEDVFHEWKNYQNVINKKKENHDTTIHKDEKNYDIWLHQKILNRLETGDIYREMKAFYTPLYDSHKRIDRREWYISEQLIQSQNMELNHYRNEYLNQEEPVYYRTLNQYELGTTNQYDTQIQSIESEMVEAVLLNTINQAYALRKDMIQNAVENEYNFVEGMQSVVENTISRFEEYHQHNRMTYQEAEHYNKMLQENSQTELHLLQQLMEQHRQEVTYSSENIVQELYHHEDKHIHGQQIDYLTQEQEFFKQQLTTNNQLIVEKQKQPEQPIQNMKQQSKLQINRDRAIKEAKKALQNPEQMVLEYMNTQNAVEQVEIERRHQLEKVINKETLKIFEQIEQYHRDPGSVSEYIVANDAAMTSFVRDTSVSRAAEERAMEEHIMIQTDKKIQNTRNQEIRQQIDRVIKREIPVIQEISSPQNIELYHKVAESNLSEEMLEEIKNVNRTFSKNVEKYTEQIEESTDVHRIVTNHVNHIQLQQNEELSTMIANNVKEQVGNLTEQVYRKLEKRMDSEKRRRGL